MFVTGFLYAWISIGLWCLLHLLVLADLCLDDDMMFV